MKMTTLIQALSSSSIVFEAANWLTMDLLSDGESSLAALF